MNRRIFWCSTAIAAATFMPVSAALAEDVVMPYLCEAYGREISLTPSEPRAYAIYGRREQDMVTACAPDNPNRCRTWRLHRFDLNCGGARVPWIDVVGTANALNRGPAKVRGGRLYVRMDPWWARQRPPAWAERPKLREFEPGGMRPDHFRSPQQDFGYQPAGRAPSVEMPPGFAPVVGLNARFEGTAPAPALGFDDAPQEPDTAVGGGPAPFEERQTPPVATRQAPPKQEVDKVPPQARATAASSKNAAPAPSGVKSNSGSMSQTFAPEGADSKTLDPKTAPKAAEIAPAGPVPAPTVKASPPPAPEQEPPVQVTTPPVQVAPPTATAAVSPPALPAADPTINSIAPTILNRPGAETTAITSASSSAGDKVGAEVAAAQTALPATIETAANPVPLIAPAATSWPALMMLMALAMISAALAYVVRRRSEQGSALRPADRDLSAVSLDGVRSRAVVKAQVAAVPAKAATFSEPEPTPSEPPPVSPPAAGPETGFAAQPANIPDWLPATREEALQVLGAGPDASDAVIKKIVDGLRMSWHPDHAKNPDDHRMRSQRLTQINVAWDILSGRQTAA